MNTETKNDVPNTAQARLANDVKPKQIYTFAAVILAAFAIAFCLKYVFPNVPEYITERIIAVLLLAYFIFTLKNTSK